MGTKDIKSELIDHTIRLVDQADGDVERVTVRDIAAAAGVGVGLVNYHFGSKEALFHCCAQETVKRQNARLCELLDGDAGETAKERLKRLSGWYCDLLAERPGLVRMSLLDDLRRGDYTDDDIDGTMTLFMPVVTEALGQEEPDDNSRMATHMLVHALQTGFLRCASVKERIGLDFHNEDGRHGFARLALRQLGLEE